MANYNRIKTARTAPIGTIMPWGGESAVGESADNVPHGWIICDLAKRTLFAADYPLLASVIGNTYGPFPDPTNTTAVLGVNFGIVNGFPYNPPSSNERHDPSKHVDVFALPNLNQVALVDIEASRMPTDALLELGTYISENGTEGDLPDTEVESDVDITFTVQPSDNLSGRITGIVMDDPIYFDTAYVIPRKLGIDHTPGHTHRPASTSDSDQFRGTFALGTPVLEFQPGTGLPDNPNITSITAIGNRGDTSFPHSFLPGTRRITWYDPNDGGISLPLMDNNVLINANNNLVPLPPSSGTRTISSNEKIRFQYEDDYSGVAKYQANAHTGAFPPAGRYQGRKNFYASPDIPDYHRGTSMPATYVNDPVYNAAAGDPQPVNTAVTNTFATTLNHEAERWLDTTLRSHNHDPMEITMTRGSLAIPTTILVNNVSTGTTVPVSVPTALNITMNPNTPSLTMLYIIRAF